MILLDGNSLTLDQLLAIEVLCACQAIDLVAPPTIADPLARVRHRVREEVETLVDDRVLTRDIRAITQLIASGALQHACAMEVK